MCAQAAALVGQLAAERPLLICIDDAHVDGSALALARSVAGLPVPLTVLVTSAAPIEGDLDAVLGTHVRLGALGRADASALVHAVAPLTAPPHLPGETARLPSELLEALADAVRRAPAHVSLDELGEGDARVALEVVAVAGGGIEWDLWTACCVGQGQRVPYDVVRDLCARGLAETTPDGQGWRYVSGPLVTALLESAAATSRLVDHHATLARRLASDERPGSALRLGRHLQAAGQGEAAISPLFHAASERAAGGDVRGALDVLAERAAALDAIGALGEDRRRAGQSALTARLALELGELERAREEAERCLRGADNAAWAEAAGAAAWVLARIDGHEQGLAQAVAIATSGGGADAQSRVRTAYAQAALHDGDVARAQSETATAFVLVERGEDVAARGRVRLRLAEIELVRGELEEARLLIEEAAPLLDGAGAAEDIDDWHRLSVACGTLPE